MKTVVLNQDPFSCCKRLIYLHVRLKIGSNNSSVGVAEHEYIIHKHCLVVMEVW